MSYGCVFERYYERDFESLREQIDTSGKEYGSLGRINCDECCSVVAMILSRDNNSTTYLSNALANHCPLLIEKYVNVPGNEPVTLV
jgi:hypothetical protein